MRSALASWTPPWVTLSVPASTWTAPPCVIETDSARMVSSIAMTGTSAAPLPSRRASGRSTSTVADGGGRLGAPGAALVRRRRRRRGSHPRRPGDRRLGRPLPRPPRWPRPPPAPRPRPVGRRWTRPSVCSSRSLSRRRGRRATAARARRCVMRLDGKGNAASQVRSGAVGHAGLAAARPASCAGAGRSRRPSTQDGCYHPARHDIRSQPPPTDRRQADPCGWRPPRCSSSLPPARPRRASRRRARPRPATPDAHHTAPTPPPRRRRRRRRPSPVPTPVPTPTPVAAVINGTWIPAEQAQKATRHPIAVMIDDAAAARPQSGLADADIFYQALAEGGIPRYMAIFQVGDPQGRGTGPQRAPVLRRLGQGVARAVRPCRRGTERAGRDPTGQPEDPLGCRPVPLQHHALSRPLPRRARTTCTRPARSCERSDDGSAPRRPSPSRPGPSRSQRIWLSGRWAARSSCPTAPTRSRTATTARPTAMSGASPGPRRSVTARRKAVVARPTWSCSTWARLRCATTGSPAATRRSTASTSTTSAPARRSSSATARSSRPPGPRRTRRRRPASCTPAARTRASPCRSSAARSPSRSCPSRRT